MPINQNILICPSVVTGDDFIASELDYDILRNLILYWDNIAALSLSEARLQIDPSISFLIQENPLDIKNVETSPLRDGITDSYKGPPDYQFRSAQAQMFYDVAIIQAFDKLGTEPNSLWSYHEPPWGFLIRPKDVVKQAPVLQIELQNLLPKPATNIPFEEILKFKSKRKDELERMQAEIQSLIRDAENDPNATRGRLLAGHAIQASIKALDRVSRESGIMSALRGSVTVSIDMTAAATAFAGAAALLNQSHLQIFQLPIGLTAAAGAGMGLISCMFFRKKAILSTPDHMLAFRYAHDVKKHLS